MMDRERQKLDAIRRQLEVEFGGSPERREPSRHRAGAAAATGPGGGRRRARGTGLVWGGLALLAFAAGGGAGAGVVLLYVMRDGAVVTADRARPGSTPEAKLPPTGTGAVARPSPPAPETELPPRPEPRPRAPDPGAAPPRPATAPRDLPDAAVYYLEGRYFRSAGGQWLVARRREGPWERLPEEEVPPTLRALPDVYRTMPEDREGTLPRAERRTGVRPGRSFRKLLPNGHGFLPGNSFSLPRPPAANWSTPRR